MKTTNYTCICCPLGCAINLTESEDKDLKVSGNSCQRGQAYAIGEYTNPQRIITATIATTSREHRRLPVKTAAPIPKSMVPDLLETLRGLLIDLPVKMGEVVLPNFQQSGVDIVATRTIK